jgi:Sulfotransferase family
MTTKIRPGMGKGTRSTWVKFGAMASRRLWFLDSNKLCAAARRRTGLRDFGDPPIEPALSVLVESLEEEAELRPLGRFLMRIHLRTLLETRLRLAHAWKGKLDTLDSQRIRKPVFIVGMPRSGSTFLHELLTEDAGYRAPRVWEVMFPVGSRSGAEADKARRIRQAEACLWWFRRLAPRADAVYPMRALTPHECVAIHSYTFLSQEFVSTCQIPAYEAFLKKTDLTPAYQWEKRFLQHLQMDDRYGDTADRVPAKRWVLKSPDHVHGLEELFAVFPDAWIVQTHRNPVEVLKSSAELTGVLRGLYGPPGDPAEIRAREARVLGEGTERFLQFRDEHPELTDRFIDVKYTELVADPLHAVRRIYARLDAPLTPAAAERIQQLAATRSRYSGRRASAEAAVVQLQGVAEIDRFERYCARFELPSSETDLSR